LISGRRPGHVKAAIALVFSACLLVAAALAAGAAGLDMRGSWALDVTAGGTRSVQTLEITSMDIGSGAFGGNIIYSAQRASVSGTVSGSKVRFHSTPGSSTPSTGSAADWAGDVSGSGVAVKMSGTVTPGTGQSGTFSGSRVTAAVPLDSTHTPSSGRPALPPGGQEVSPGQLPRQCTAGETSLRGYYFSDTAKTWISSPFCYLRWGNLEASGSTVVAAGAQVTVTAIPTDGSNSGTYAPQTGSIHWTFPGQAVSGCGAADLTCSAIPTKVASTEWQWFEFHVTMPRTFFIDSPGDLCGGQHLCAGATTNAWSYVGIAPTRTAPGSAGTPQAPAVIGGSGPIGGQGSGAGGGPSAEVIVGMAAVLATAGVGAAVVAATRNPLGASAATLRRVGDVLSGMRGSSGKSGGATTSGKSGGGTTSGKGAGMSPGDITALVQQFSQMSQATQSASPSPTPPSTPPPTPPQTPPPVSPDSPP
jgi:hypothetical protein